MPRPSRRALLCGLASSLPVASGCVGDSTEWTGFRVGDLILRNWAPVEHAVEVRIVRLERGLVSRSEEVLFSETYELSGTDLDEDHFDQVDRTVQSPVGDSEADAVRVTVDDRETTRIRYDERALPESGCFDLALRVETGGELLHFETPCGES